MEPKKGLLFDASKNIFKNKYELWMALKQPDQSIGVALPLSFEFSNDPEYAPKEEPTLSMNLEEATRLMDALWGAGIRPTEVGSPGELAATKYHLEDMRKIAMAWADLQK